jgi:tetratricopeptide (TPR) repeat protein
LELSRGRPEAALGYGERLADPAETAAPLRAMIDLELRRGRPEAARPYAERLEKVSGGTPAGRADAARRTAEVRAALGDAEGAAAGLRRALAAVPEDPQALRQMLDLLVSRGRPEDALPYAERLEKKLESASPSDRADAARRTARVRSEVALKSGRPEAALADAERLVEEAKGGAPKERAEAYARLAEAQGAAKDVAAQERSLRLALEADPENALAARAWVDLALALGRPEEALPYARRLAAAPKAGRGGVPADAYRRLARVQRRLKDEAGAEASLRLALAADPAEPKTYGLLLDLLRARPREALAVVAAVPPEGSPGRAERLGLRGVAEALGGDAAAARADFAAAAALDAKALCFSPAFGPGRDLLPPVYFEVCLERFPADPDLYRDRGVALFRAGRTAEAADAFRKVLELKPGDEEAAESLRALEGAGPGGRDWPTAPRSAPAGRPSPL